MIKNIKLNKIFFIIVFFELTFTGIIINLLQKNISLQTLQNKAEYERFEMNRAADQLKQSSDDLTRFARTYVVTGDKKYKDIFDKILDIREGKAPRPKNYDTVYWDYLEPLRSKLHPDEKIKSLYFILDSLPFSEEERAKLYQGFRNSNNLVKIEYEAFQAMEGLFKNKNGKYDIKGDIDQKYAIELLYSHEYHLAKQNIMQPIDEFISMLNMRTSNLISSYNKDLKQNVVKLITILILFIICNIYILIILHQRIIKVINYITGEIKKSKKDSSEYQPLNNKRKDELGILIKEFNSMNEMITKKRVMLTEKNDKLSSQYEMINNYIIISETDLDGKITNVSNSFCKISGYTREELIGKTHSVLSHEDNPKDLFVNMWKKLEKMGHWEGEIINRKKNGESYWTEVKIDTIKDTNGNNIGYRSVRIDITNKKKIEKISITDKLTGLNNRMKLDEVFDYELRKVERYKRELTIIMIDIDHFKDVNDTYGHQLGDTVLKEFSNVILKNIRSVDTFGRWGGEEFLLICPEVSANGAVRLGKKLQRAVENHRFSKVGKKTACFGMTNYHVGDTKEKMISRADEALYQGKKNGRNKVIFS